MKKQIIDCSASVANLIRMNNGKPSLTLIEVDEKQPLQDVRGEYTFTFYWAGHAPQTPCVRSLYDGMGAMGMLCVTAEVFEKEYAVFDPVTKTSVVNPNFSVCEMAVKYNGYEKGLISTPFFERIEIDVAAKTVEVTMGN